MIERSGSARRPGRAKRLLRHVELNANRAFLLAFGAVGGAAGILSASEVLLPLWLYLLLATSFFVLALVVMQVSPRRLRLTTVSALSRLWPGGGDEALRADGPSAPPNRPGDPAPHPEPALPPADSPWTHLADPGTGLRLLRRSDRAPAAGVPPLTADDPVYLGGFRQALTGGADPLRPMLVVPSPPRDVSRPESLLVDVLAGKPRTLQPFDPVSFGLEPSRPAPGEAPELLFDRGVPGDTEEEHTLAIRDLLYAADLRVAFDRLVGSDCEAAQPFIWPEHCVDPLQLADHDLIIVGGPDTNYWHGLLYEMAFRAFAHPPSEIPLALGMRKRVGARPMYSSEAIYTSLWQAMRQFYSDRADDPDWPIDERSFPTTGMIVACRNPLRRPGDDTVRRCFFVAGPRSLGTSGALLGLAEVVSRLAADEASDFWSLVPSLGAPDELAGLVSALLVRVTEVERQPARADQDGPTTRSVHRMADVGPDPGYHDSFVPVSVEYLRYEGVEAAWAPLVTTVSAR